MALTLTTVERSVFGRFKVAVVEADFDDSLAAGGEALAPADVGMTAILFVAVEDADSGYVVKYDRAGGKLTAYQSIDPGDTGGADTPLVEAASADLGALPVRLLCIGV